MELDRLEVVISANFEKLESQFGKIMPFIDKTMAQLERATSSGISRTEKNLDLEQGTSAMSQQLDKMTQTFEKQMARISKTANTGSEDIGKNMSKGFTKARKHVGKDIDLIINDINAKMGQAKAQQEKLAFLRSQRQGAVSANDTKGTVKYDEQIARAQSAMTKYQNGAKALARSIQAEFEAVPTSLDKITTKMAQNEGQIEKLRSRIRLLQTEYANQKTPVGNFTDGFKNIGETKKSTKTAGEIDHQSLKMQKLIAANDDLQKAYALTEDRASQLKSALGGVNTKLSESSVKTGTAAEAVKKVAKGTNESRNNFSRFGGLFNRTANSISHGTRRIASGIGGIFKRSTNKIGSRTKQMKHGMGGLGRRIRNIAKQVFVFSLVYKGLRLMGQGLTASLQTNNQFKVSLNQIKVNLLTAFYPIYTAVLPAINTLMSVIAKATGILASFIATLFGTTFSAAKQGAQGLYHNIQAMNDSGMAADKNKAKIQKLQRSLMGFDEINSLSLDQPEAEPTSHTGPKVSSPNFDVPNWTARPSGVLTDFFKPFQDSWNKHGNKVISAWKYAFGEVWGLVKAIGSSFMLVWTNGAGERLITNLLELFANILLIIGDIASAFKNAWKDNGRGTALIKAIFDLWNGILELINEIATSFRNVWNNGTGELIALLILEIITNIFEAITNITTQLKEAWTEGQVGEAIFQGILDIVVIVLETINKITKGTSTWAKKLDFRSLLESIDTLLQVIKPVAQVIGDDMAWYYENVLLPLAGFVITDVIPVFLDILSAAIEFLYGVIKLVRPLFDWLWEKFLLPLASFTGGVIVDTLKMIGGGIQGLADVVNHPKKAFKDLGKWTEDKFKGIFGSVDDNSKKSLKSTTDNSDLMKSGFDLNMLEMVDNAKKNGRNISTNVRTAAETARDRASEAWQKMKDNVAGFNDQIKDGTEKAFDQVVDWAKGLGKKIGDALANGFKAVKEGAKKIADGVIEFPLKAINGVIKGVSWVLDKVGAKSAAKGMGEYAIANYAQGTAYHPGGLAMVNDGQGDAFREAFRLPNGQTGLFPNTRNLVVDLPAGTSVLSGSETARMIPDYLPAYNKGVGNWFKTKWEGIKKFSGDIWDYATNPSKLLEVAISRFTNLTKALDPSLSIATGAISTTAKAATEFIKTKMDTFFSQEGGGHDGSIGIMGAYRYLSDVALKVIERFPLMRITSGMREGDPFYHGKRQAIDIAFPASMNGTPENTKAANYAFERFASKVAYVITNGRVRDRSGMSGHGSSSRWLRWRDNDHYDHVHINGLLGAADIGKGGGNSPAGTGVERWRSTIQRALNRNGLPSDSRYTNAWLRQVQSESGGNERAVQHGFVDINTIRGDLAKGLLQTISSTFNAYKHPGHGNIFKGFDNALAAINYAKQRYGPTRMLQVIGHGHGYENGGRVTKEGLYTLAEGNQEEWVIPMKKPSIAKKMVFEAMDYLGLSAEFMTLKLPELVTDQPKGFAYDSRTNHQQFKEGGLVNMGESVVQAIVLALEQSGNQQPLSPTGDVVINIGGKEFGRISVKEINKYHEQIGYTELNI